MPIYTIQGLERYWVASVTRFRAEYGNLRAVLAACIETASGVASSLSERRSLEANCAYLLLAKATNHVASTVVLLERGLMVDAALTGRNTIETALLLELVSKRQELCPRWSAGEVFAPSNVRKQLAELADVTIGEVVISVTPDEYDEARLAYNWLSRITHANLESLSHTATQTGEKSFVVHIGGEVSVPVAVAIVKSVGVTLLRAMLTALAVHDPAALRAKHSELKNLAATIGRLGEKA
jgi:hypothetical protein